MLCTTVLFLRVHIHKSGWCRRSAISTLVAKEILHKKLIIPQVLQYQASGGIFGGCTSLQKLGYWCVLTRSGNDTVYRWLWACHDSHSNVRTDAFLPYRAENFGCLCWSTAKAWFRQGCKRSFDISTQYAHKSALKAKCTKNAQIVIDHFLLWTSWTAIVLRRLSENLSPVVRPWICWVKKLQRRRFCGWAVVRCL